VITPQLISEDLLMLVSWVLGLISGLFLIWWCAVLVYELYRISETEALYLSTKYH